MRHYDCKHYVYICKTHFKKNYYRCVARWGSPQSNQFSLPSSPGKLRSC